MRAKSWILGSLSVVAVAGLARGDAADPFGAASPAFDFRAPAGRETASPWAASDTGAFGYTVGIEVPPGRAGMAPSLALTYSSDGGERGGVAVGWTLAVPEIRFVLPDGPGDQAHYETTFGGGGRLVQVTDAPLRGGNLIYRLEHEGTFARFERHAQGWLVGTPDGVEHYFGLLPASRVGTKVWRLERVLDARGNLVVYGWAHRTVTVGDATAIDIELESVQYGGNPDVGVDHHARVLFERSADDCAGAPVGAELDAFQTMTVTGSRRLTRITTQVRPAPGAAWRNVRRIDLGYASPAGTCAPRLLTSLRTMAYGTTGAATVLPATTLGYSPERSFQTMRQLSGPGLADAHSGTAAGTERDLMDMDGDGRVDLVRVERVTDGCVLRWRKAGAAGTYEATERTTRLPSLPFASPADAREVCTLRGQRSLFGTDRQPPVGHGQNCRRPSTLAYAFEDFDGDGNLDVVAHGTYAYEYSAARVTQFQIPGTSAHEQGAAGAAMTPYSAHTDCVKAEILQADLEDRPVDECACSTSCQCKPENCALPPTPGPPHPGPTPEPVPNPNSCIPPDAEHRYASGTRIYPWRVFPGKGDGTFDLTDGWLVAAPVPLGGGPDAWSSTTASWANRIPRLADMNGDGLPDVIDPGQAVEGPSQSQTWRVYLNTGRNFAGVSWSGATIDKVAATWHLPGLDEQSYLYDMNGDGRPDHVTRSEIRFNTGSGFAAPIDWAPGTATLERHVDATIGGVDVRSLVEGFLDVDGDGLVDRVWFDAQGARVRRNLGGGRLGPVTTFGGTAGAKAQRTLRKQGDAWRLVTAFQDLDGDGLGDLAAWQGDTVSLATDALPARRLVSIDNGQGARTEVAYAPATSRGQARWLVSRIEVAVDGKAPAVTQVSHEDPAFGRIDHRAGRDRLLGFRKVTTVGSAGARQIVERSFEVSRRDRRGRVVKVTVEVPDGAGGWQRASEQETAWSTWPMLGGASWFTYAERRIERTCDAAGACAASRTTEWHYEPHVHDGQVVLWRVRRTGVSGSDVPDTRWTASEHEVRYTGRYFVLETRREEGAGGVYLPRRNALALPAGSGLPALDLEWQLTFPAARVDRLYDDRGLLIEEKVWSSETTSGRTIFEPDEVGNVVAIKRPNGWTATHRVTNALASAPLTAARGFTFILPRPIQVQPILEQAYATTRMDYDDLRLFLKKTTNPLGHEVTTAFDPATGAKLRQAGPN